MQTPAALVYLERHNEPMDCVRKEAAKRQHETLSRPRRGALGRRANVRRERAELVLGGRDVDEGHKGILAVAHANAVFMTSSDVPGVLAPGLSNRPSRTKSVRTAGVIEAEFLQRVWIRFK